jgi:hypothetical protein
MQFEIYQWLVPLIGLIYIGRTFIQFRKGKRTIRGTIVWMIFWVVIIVLAVIPNPVSHKMAEVLGFRSNINAVIFVALGLLFLLVFYLSSSLDRMERQMTELVRQLAIKEEEKKENEES